MSGEPSAEWALPRAGETYRIALFDQGEDVIRMITAAVADPVVSVAVARPGETGYKRVDLFGDGTFAWGSPWPIPEQVNRLYFTPRIRSVEPLANFGLQRMPGGPANPR